MRSTFKVVRASAKLLFCALALLLIATPSMAQVELIDTVTTDGFPGFWSDLRIGDDGTVHVAFQDSSSDLVRYARRDSSDWFVETVDEIHTGGWYPSLALGAGGMVHVSYFGRTAARDSFGLYHATLSDTGEGTPWSVEKVGPGTTTLFFGSWSSLAVGSDDEPRIAYMENNADRRLNYAARAAGSWTIEIADTTDTTGFEAAMTLDHVDAPSISHLRYFEDSLALLYTFKNGGAWTTEEIDRVVNGDIGWAEIDVDSGGSPAVIYLRENSHKVYLGIRQAAGGWITSEIDEGAVDADSKPLSIMFDSEDRLNLLYYRGDSNGLRYSRYYGGIPFWIDIDTDGKVGDFNSLEVDDNGVAHMSYFDRGAGALMYARAKVQLSGIAVTPSDTTMRNGDSFSMTVGADFGGEIPLTLGPEATWVSRAPNIVTVNDSGTVTAVAKGEAVIVATFDGFSDSSTVTVEEPAEPFYIIFSLEKDHWDPVAFPLEPVNPSATIMSTLIDSLGSPDPKVWKLGHWNPASNRYDSLSSESDRTEIGLGYWLRTAESTPFATPAGYYPEGDFVVSLEGGPGDVPGWNQIGFPHNGEIDIDDILVTDRTDTFSLGSVQNELTESRAMGWINDNYADLGSVGRGSALWVRKVAAGTVDLIFPIDAVTATKHGSEIAAKNLWAETEWSVSVIAEQSDRHSAKITIGAAEFEGNRPGRFDFALPPPPPGNPLTLAIPRADLGRMNGNYQSSFFIPTEVMTWELLLSGAEAPGSVTLSLDLDRLPAGALVEITDHATGETLPISASNSTSIAATKDDRTISLTIRPEGGPSSGTIVNSFRNAYPNPFGSETGFRFRLARPTEISLTIYAPSGRQVRRLQSMATTTGDHVIVWDGIDGAGRNAAPGVYFARYEFAGSEGSTRIVKVR